MKRSVFAVIAGLAVWWLVATLLNFGLRAGLAGYTLAEPTLTFALGMKVARLILGALASLAAGAAAGLIAPSKTRSGWVLGAIILALFIPVHIQLWAKFPVWYHLVFLGTLLPMVRLGAALTRSRNTGTPADDPFRGRQPTSHERLSGRPWDASYHDGTPPWDIGQPQPAVLRLASEGGFAGAVLDAGCGTGENALHIALLGLPVLGFDVAETALATARKKAADRGIKVEFTTADALQLERLGRMFKTVLDCGLFHSFDEDDERMQYASSLASVTEHGGTLYVLCFSDKGPDTGPHPISQQELIAAFNPKNGWHVSAIEPDRLQTRFHDHGASAWFARIKRI
jgi:SAM-dependent methyltransferase